MTIQALEQNFSICKIEDFSQVNFEDEFYFIGTTDEERSLVCPTKSVPTNTLERDDGWKGFRIEGNVDFSLVGILSQLSGILAEHGIEIFAVSTFNTDYILVKDDKFPKALHVLQENGYQVH